MMKADEAVLSECMFFVSNRLSNILRREAEKAFSGLDICTSEVYLLIVVSQYDGITQTELSGKLDIAPSTCTRFVDKMIHKGLLRKKYNWKTAHVFMTDKGREVCEGIDECLLRFHRMYSDILGEEASARLTSEMRNACEILSKKA